MYEPRVEMDMLSWKLRVIRHLVDWRDQTTSRSQRQRLLKMVEVVEEDGRCCRRWQGLLKTAKVVENARGN
jgi:hypothetical protein